MNILQLTPGAGAMFCGNCLRNIELVLEEDAEGLRLAVDNDGSGFAASPPARDGMGLRIMRYRAESVGGVVHIGTRPSGGVQVVCTIPAKRGPKKESEERIKHEQSHS
jgi:signal transduction histidine kinase